MLLSELHVRGLFAAAKSGEIVKREWLLDAMTVVNKYEHEIEVKQPFKLGDVLELEQALFDIEAGQIVFINYEFLGIVISAENMLAKVAVLSKKNEPIYHRLDEFAFSLPMAQEYLGKNVFTQTPVNDLTTVGLFLENVIVLGYPTEFNQFGFINTEWKFGKIVKMVTDAMVAKKVTVKQYRKFVDNLFYLNHISEICVPSMSERSLMTHPDIPRVKAEFIKAHKDQMNDPFVIKELEDKLIALDKEWLGVGTKNADSSVTFFDGLGKKSYDLHRKKLFVIVGGTPSFDQSTGKYEFNQNSLMDGWTVEAIPSIANETRRGSYDRGVETAKGGAETKLVYRVFQDLKIAKDDCGTKRTIKADFGKIFRIKDFLGRVIRVGGVDIEITEENMSKFDGKIVDLYSPLTCSERYDLCYKCCGRRCKELGVKFIGLQTVKITSKFMQTAMKSMHGNVLQVVSPKLEDVLL